MKMKKLISMLLAVIMVTSVMAVPAFAYEAYDDEFVYGSNSSYGMEYGHSGGMVGTIRKTDEYGKTIYVHGTPLNNNTFALVNAPAMDYTKTIGSVTFSNYIKHNEKTLNDDNFNQIKVTQVYVGIGASMRSEVDRVEFMMGTSGSFNQTPEVLKGQGYGSTSDLMQIKTNTPCYVYNNGTPTYKFLDYFSVRPYTNLGRNYDGTWQKGLTWVFEEHTKSTDTAGGAGWGYLNDANKYRKIYPITVVTQTGVEYYQVIVTNEGNFAGQKVETPVQPQPEEKPAVTYPAVAPASPTTSPIYINGVLTEFEAYNINGNNYFKLRDVALAIRGTEKQFEVIWNASYTENGVRGAVDMTSLKAYTTVGGEMKKGDGVAKTANITTSPILKDGQKVNNLAGYNINGNNFFKLRDLGALFDFNVSWDSNLRAVIVNTAESYDDSN